jgi:ribose 5-phosphate isomerase B
MTEREEIQQLVRSALNEKLSGAPPTVASDISAESVKRVITEREILAVPAGGQLLIRADAVITPAAQDAVRERGITLQKRSSSSSKGSKGHGLHVAVGSDHGGFAMKEQLKTLLTKLGHQARDFGTHSEDAFDYPDFAHAVAHAVAQHTCDLGIVIDGAGIGSCMVANKVPGVRAAMCYDEATARNSREHNYANLLTLGGKMIAREQMEKIVTAWLATPEGEARHGKRVAKIMAIEKQYSRNA